MVATVNSTGTSTGVVITPDSSGVLALQTGGTTAITVDASQNTTFVGNLNTAAGKKYQVGSSTVSALAWVNFVGSTGVVTSGYNVSSVTRASTGLYTVNFTTAQTDANYAVLFGICGGTAAGGTNAAFVGSVIGVTQYGAPNNKTTSACQIGTNDYTATFRDFGQVSVAFFGN